MQRLIQAGKIRGFGVGLESLAQAMEWLAVDGLSHLQIPFGVLDPQAGRSIIGAARERGVAVIARGIFAAGLLADISPDDERQLEPLQRQHRCAIRDIAAGAGIHPLALAAWYVRSTPGVSDVLIGVSSIAHLDQNLRHLRVNTVSDDVLERVRSAVDAYLDAQSVQGP
jgi:aryl-alcohol dehydrogenase-like predicted oxidoreductase